MNTYKNILSIITILMLFSCSTRIETERIQEQKSNWENISAGDECYYRTAAHDYYTNGIHYKIIASSHGAIQIINISKDSIDMTQMHK